MNYMPNNVIGYRMDRWGGLYVHEMGEPERKATEAEIRELIEKHPDWILRLAWQG